MDRVDAIEKMKNRIQKMEVHRRVILVICVCCLNMTPAVRSVFSEVNPSFLNSIRNSRLLPHEIANKRFFVVNNSFGANPVYIRRDGPNRGRFYILDLSTNKTVWAPPEIEKQALTIYEKWVSSPNGDQIPPIVTIALTYLKRTYPTVSEPAGPNVPVDPHTSPGSGHPTDYGNHGQGRNSQFAKLKEEFNSGNMPLKHDIGGVANEEKEFFNYKIFHQTCAWQSNPNPDKPFELTLGLYSHGKGRDQKQYVAVKAGIFDRGGAEAVKDELFNRKVQLSRNEAADALFSSFEIDPKKLPPGALIPGEGQMYVKAIERENHRGSIDFISKYVLKIKTDGVVGSEKPVVGDLVLYCSTLPDERPTENGKVVASKKN